MSSPLLTETFGRLNDTKVVFSVQLFSTEVICQPQQGNAKQYNISLASVIGCRCMKAGSGNDRRSFLTIYAYPKSGSGVRRRQTYTFYYGGSSDYEKNFMTMKKWKHVISYLISVRTPDMAVLQPFLDCDTDTLPIAERRWLVLLNPFSGKKNSEKVFSSTISGMLTEAEIDYTVIKTEYAGHARDFVRQAQLDSFTGVITSSGDGLFFEVINGLMTRQDWSNAIKMPLGIIPTGTGNALSAMLCMIAGERVDKQHPLHAAYLLLRSDLNCRLSNAFDLMAIDTVEGRKFSFLAVAWGIVSDVDIESEKYRFMGDARFIVGAITRVMSLRTYRGRVSFLPVDAAEAKRLMQSRRMRNISSTNKKATSSSVPSSTVLSDDGQRHTLNGQDAIDYPSAGRYRSVDDLTGKGNIKGATSTASLVTSTPVSLGTSQIASGASPYSNPSSSTDAPNTSFSSGILDNSSDNSPVETSLLPSLSEPVPLNWMTIEDSFIGVVATRCSHLSYDMAVHTPVRPDDGCIWLSITRAPLSKPALTRQLFAMMRGDRIDVDPAYGVELYRVHAFRIEPVPPSPPTRIMTVDGERVPYGTIQGQILPGIASLI